MARNTPLYSFKKALVYGKGLEKAEKLGFCMMIRGNDRFLDLMQKYKDKHNSESLVIYSMWDGYLSQPESKLLPLMNGFSNVVNLHTSGHATHKAIADVCDAVRPKQAIIPIHSTNSAGLEAIGIKYPVCYINDSGNTRVKE